MRLPARLCDAAYLTRKPTFARFDADLGVARCLPRNRDPELAGAVSYLLTVLRLWYGDCYDSSHKQSFLIDDVPFGTGASTRDGPCCRRGGLWIDGFGRHKTCRANK